jgi:subtilisin family serine protease
MSSLRIDQCLPRLRAALSSSLLIAVASCPFASAASVDPKVLADAARNGSVDAILVLADQTRPLLGPLKTDGDYRVRRRALISALRARADRDQAGVRAWLDARGIAHRDFWIANLIQVRLPAAALAELAVRNDIERVDPNPQIPLRLPPVEPAATPDDIGAVGIATGIAWGVAKIEAPAVWSAGFTGQGVVIGGEDTGYQWNHPALEPQYRGWNGVAADHNYNWHDAIHDSTTSSCANNSPAPCDDVGHGTGTAGVFAGDDGLAAIPRHQTGVAPGARWIGCRNMDAGIGTPARYIECMQWMLAPTDLDDANANSDLAPDVVSNSWACGTDEGCTPDVLETAVGNLVAGGIFYAAAAQNSGPACTTIDDPPAIYGASFDIGATDVDDVLANFSSRGPVGGDMTIRPDVSAPGVGVCTSIPSNGYTCSFTGTSAATPHVAGVVALMLSAFPALRGHPGTVADILRATATTQGVTNTAGVTQSCGGTPITQWPNYMVGYGRVDAWNAVREPVFIDGFDR